MNDTETTVSYERYRQARAKVSKGNKRAVFNALAAANIARVLLDFDGEGDTGQIQTVIAYRGKELAALPTTTVRVRSISWGDTKPVITEATLKSAIETLCYDYLEDEHGGWENNEGAYGEFRLDVATREVELEFNGRVMDIDTSHHTF